MSHQYPAVILVLALSACASSDREPLGSSRLQLKWSDGTEIECTGGRSASGSGASDGSQCEEEVEQCAGEHFTVRCARASVGADTACDCLMAGEVVDSFEAPNYCLEHVSDLFAECVFPR